MLILGLLPIGLLAGDKDKAPSAMAASPKLAPLNWIAGSWRADVDGDQLDEVWTAPSGDSMFGSFRWMKAGKAWMFELLTIVAEGEGVILRVKHFDAKGVGWEAKDDAITMKLAPQTGPDAVFVQVKVETPIKLSFLQRQPAGLNVRLEVPHEGKVDIKEFQFTRVLATPGK